MIIISDGGGEGHTARLGPGADTNWCRNYNARSRVKVLVRWAKGKKG